jgi:hypothetical protein
MNGLLARIFGPKRQPVAVVEHPTLGRLDYDRESEVWRQAVQSGALSFRLSVGGEGEPDPQLLQAALRVKADLPSIISALSGFLAEQAQAAEMVQLADEIRALIVEEVGVWWPKEPDSVMIWFKGPSEDRVWHCDYRSGRLSGLAFDD